MISMMMARVGSSGTGSGQEEVELRDNIRFSQGKLPVEDVEEFPFYAADIAFAKYSGPCRPIDVLR